MNKKLSSLPPSIEHFLIALAGIVVVNIGLLVFLNTQVKVISLLQDQEKQLQQDQKIINSSEEIYNKYKNDIAAISDVFPNEEKVLPFLQLMENLAKKYSDDSAVKFASLSPQPEGDNLYLLFSIGMKTDPSRLSDFLTELESLPYMTRVLTISMSLPDGISGKVNVTINLKLYVKNPFSAE